MKLPWTSKYMIVYVPRTLPICATCRSVQIARLCMQSSCAICRLYKSAICTICRSDQIARLYIRMQSSCAICRLCKSADCAEHTSLHCSHLWLSSYCLWSGTFLQSKSLPFFFVTVQFVSIFPFPKNSYRLGYKLFEISLCVCVCVCVCVRACVRTCVCHCNQNIILVHEHVVT